MPGLALTVARREGLADARQRRSLTQAELGKAVGVSQRAMGWAVPAS